MNPYARFGLVSNAVSAAAILGFLAVIGPDALSALTTATDVPPQQTWGMVGAGVVVMVVFWLAMTEAIFPALFRFNSVRRLILGKYYFEGTWLQSEKGDGENRMSVIDIQPKGKGFIFSGYSLNAELEIERNTLIEFSDLDWPFMTYKYRNSLSDGADGRREGVGELQFEMNKASPRRYNGYAQFVRNSARLNIEGAKLTQNREVKNLRTLQGRRKVFQKYWELFFNSSTISAPKMAPMAATVPAPAPAAAPKPSPVAAFTPAPVEPVAETPSPEPAPVNAVEPKVEETLALKPETAPLATEQVIARRRTSDWAKQPSIKARINLPGKTGTNSKT